MIASTCQHLVSHMLHFVDEGAFSEPSFIGFFSQDELLHREGVNCES